MRFSALWGVFALVASLLFALPAAADDKARAKELFSRGMELVKSDNYPAALDAFQKSYELYPKAALLFNIAMCQKALYRYVDSMKTFGRYLEETGEDVDPKMRSAVESAMDEMESLVGKLHIKNPPDGAEVLVDGKSLGSAPFADDLVLDPGQHTVQVELNGYKPLRLDVTVASGAVVPVRASLEQVEAWLEVGCSDADTDSVVRIDGEVVGGCPWSGEVSAGSHQVTVETDGASPFERTVEVSPGKTTAVEVSAEVETEDEGARGLLVAGISALAVGVGAGVLGGVFHYRGSKDEKDLDELAGQPDRKAYNSKKDDLRVDQAMTATGYALSAALLATGVVLIAVDAAGGEEPPAEKAAVAIRPTAGGLAISF
jgi:hypothetical protein